MSNVEDVEAAEARMNAAQDALLKYVERREAIDAGRYRQLVARLKKAHAGFLKAISELGK